MNMQKKTNKLLKYLQKYPKLLIKYASENNNLIHQLHTFLKMLLIFFYKISLKKYTKILFLIFDGY